MRFFDAKKIHSYSLIFLGVLIIVTSDRIQAVAGYRRAPSIGKFSAQVKAKIKTLIKKYCKSTTNVRLVFTSNKISSYFSLKDAIPMHITPCVIYKFACSNCNVCYIGETTKQFIVRVKEHLFTDKGSAIYRHLNKDATCKGLCLSLIHI